MVEMPTSSAGWPRDEEVDRRLALAREAAREAGELTLRYFRDERLAVELKADQSPVTIADRAAEELLRQRIAGGFGADGILGEEFGEVAGTSGFRWILDPIDGTKSFIHGVPLYGTMVGVEFGGQAIAGVIALPALDECIWAALGRGAWHERPGHPAERAKVSATARLADSLFCTSDAKSFADSGRGAVYERLQAATRLGRTWGDCYGYVLVATGRAEMMLDPIMNVWDAAAVQPIIEEAGGTFTDWRGRRAIDAGEGIATNGHVWPELLALLDESEK